MAYYEDIVSAGNNQVKCILCANFIQDQEPFIEEHLNNRKHKELYIKRLMARNSIDIRSSDLFCSLCNFKIRTGDLVPHVHTGEHLIILASLKEVIEKDGGFIEIPINFEHKTQCILCSTEIIDFTESSVKSHLSTEKHRRAKAMLLQPWNGIFSVEGHDDYLWCKICQKFFDNYIEVIFEHVENAPHTTDLIKIMNLVGKDISIDKYLQNLTQDKAFCNKCGIEVPCNVDNIYRHTTGKKHLSA